MQLLIELLCMLYGFFEPQRSVVKNSHGNDFDVFSDMLDQSYGANFNAQRVLYAVRREKEENELNELVKLIHRFRNRITARCWEENGEFEDYDIKAEWLNVWKTGLQYLDMKFGSELVNGALRKADYHRNKM